MNCEDILIRLHNNLDINVYWTVKELVLECIYQPVYHQVKEQIIWNTLEELIDY